MCIWDFPGSLVVNNLRFHCIGRGIKISRALWCSQKKKKKSVHLKPKATSDQRISDLI